MIRCALLFLALSGCAALNDSEAVDQGAHYALGYGLARDMARWGTSEEVVAIVMAFAEAREDLQHPGQCNAGCQLDLDNWRRGAEAGAASQE